MRKPATAPGRRRSPAWLRAARGRLSDWYAAHARDLPWRRTRDPYAVWVSEIMLQQTQVATVVRYFPRFLGALPDVGTLAAADEEQVLRLWEGLGYYRRARQLHAAAKVIVAEHGGQFPTDYDAVRSLPGIGRYTAGAILSIAFKSRFPILEANTIRLLSRLLAYRGDVSSAAGREQLWQAAEMLLPASDVGQFNQALMELGSRICTPRDPGCQQCPLAALCPTRRLGLQHRIPRAAKRPRVEERHEAAVIVVRGGRVLLRKCALGQRWAGLWDFPRFPLAADSGKSETKQLVEGVRRVAGIAITKPSHLATLRHGVTRFRITLDAYVAGVRRSCGLDGGGQLRWVEAPALADYPLSTTGRKLARLWEESRNASSRFLAQVIDPGLRGRRRPRRCPGWPSRSLPRGLR